MVGRAACRWGKLVTSTPHGGNLDFVHAQFLLSWPPSPTFGSLEQQFDTAIIDIPLVLLLPSVPPHLPQLRSQARRTQVQTTTLFPPLTPGAMSQSKSTSVFHALGSYADRIKPEQSNGKSGSNSGVSTPSPSPAPGHSTEHYDDDGGGSWETVSTVRQKKRSERNTERTERQEDKGRSNSRNWRDRGDDKTASTTAADKEKDGSAKKDASVSTASSSRAATPRASAASTPPKSAWSATGPASPPAPSNVVAHNTSEPAEKSVEPAANGSGSNSGHSHKPSGDKAPTKADEEDNWRRKEPVPTPTPTPAIAMPAKIAPPPSVNAWDLRKKQLPVASASTSKEPTPAQAGAAKTAGPVAPKPAADVVAEASRASTTALQSAEVKDGKPSGKKPKKKGADTHSGDATAWPQVSQAAEVKAEDKKDKHAKQLNDSTIDDGSSAQGGKKQKWTKMSASELQEAADKVAAETSRRQTKHKQRLREGGDEPVKKGVNKQRAQHEKLAALKPPRTHRSGSHGSSTLPPLSATNGRLVSGSAGSEVGDATNGDVHAGANGTASAPTSRHGSNPGTPGKRPSPHSASSPLSPESGAAAMPHHFGTAPRRGRDRDGRGGYGGRTRGGYHRSASNTPMNRMFDLSPVGTNANLYAAGYGMGYGYYPVPANMMNVANVATALPGFDMTQAQYALFQRNMPPPPVPVTAVPNIDPLRYWVLGQVEYYFSIQNLVMDFFLRQQMDAEGWIDIAMIASFNRIKTLTADVAIVREVMALSSLLELDGDRVRLSTSEWCRWVLPDAKPVNTLGALSPSPKKSGETEVSHGIPPNVNFTDDGDGSVLGIEDVPMSPVPKFDVENALLRQGGSAAASASASVLASDEGKLSRGQVERIL
ncbi:hypothetical protein CspeluHIS016_0406540 [Cutaneotrichosporon spelunceum]|uniref:HTH La-type RNA-binding domain-containing protein n=1 Tax=Cutaneotrichosporon spelunceum TaxID=1672016 RepID=A0AAD3TWK3_9TREE|nr:hypothetical protein CspeluHIS016_0406540 [Cutaneotrichosporon spelunceum]